MIQTEPAAAATDRERYPGWDAAIAVLLGLVLLGAGWLDARTFLARRSKKPPAEFALTDPQGSQRLASAELYRSADSFVLLDNIGGLERRDGPLFRFAFGPASTLLLTTNHPHARLSVELYNDCAGQDITIRCNDTVVESLPHQPQGIVARSYPLALRPGVNNISFGFTHYNHGPLGFGLPDPRPLAGGLFLKLDLNLE